MRAVFLLLSSLALARGDLDPHRFRGSKPLVTRSSVLTEKPRRSRPNLRAPPSRNVIILFADDYGWGDVGHNNPLVTETAAIDALAAGGITLKDMHTFPLCTCVGAQPPLSRRALAPCLPLPRAAAARAPFPCAGPRARSC